MLAGQLPGRVNDDQITIFDSEGYSTLRYINEQAEKRNLGIGIGIGIGIELVPWGEHDEDNAPKDLFRYTRSRKASKSVRRIA